MRTFFNEYLYIQHRLGNGFYLGMGPKEGIPENEVFIDYPAAEKLFAYMKEELILYSEEESKKRDGELLALICGKGAKNNE